MLRTLLYLAAGFALFVIGFVAIMTLAVSVQGLAAVRSDMLSRIATGYVFVGLPAVIFGALWLAWRRPKSPPHPEPPSA